MRGVKEPKSLPDFIYISPDLIVNTKSLHFRYGLYFGLTDNPLSFEEWRAMNEKAA